MLETSFPKVFVPQPISGFILMSKVFCNNSGSCKDYSLSRCSVYGLPVQCDNIKHQLEKLENICQMSVERFGCNGTGIIKEYCRKTCSNCGMEFS